jgi:hypothetical protein
LPHLGRDAVKFGRPDGGRQNLNSQLESGVRGGHSRERKTGERLMNAIRSERIEELEGEAEADTEFAAASEVEAGIRDFVRNDVAYLRRPAVMNSTESLEPGA